jgi:DNA polymerase V
MSFVSRQMPVAEVWGIGGRTVEKLQRAGVVTIAEFVGMDSRMVRDMLIVVGARVQTELRGISCIPLALAAATRKGIAVTRSFGHPVTTWQEMREAVAAYASRAGEKLRAEGLQACHVAVFLQTDPHRPEEQWHSGQRAGRIEPTSDSMALITEALWML